MSINFDNSYFENNNGIGYGNYGDICKASDSYITREYQRIKDYYTLPVLQTFKVLDIGCGYGKLVQLMRADGINCIGIDASSHCISKDMSGGFISQKSILSPTGYKKSEFDLVVSMYMLESLYDGNNTTSKNSIGAAVIEINRIGKRLWIVESIDIPSHYKTTLQEAKTQLESLVAPRTVTYEDGIAFQPSIRAIV